jgi:hypothetical protein
VYHDEKLHDLAGSLRVDAQRRPGRKGLSKELLDIATRHASIEEAIGAVVVQGDGKMVPDSSRGTSSKASDKDAKKGAKDGKKGQTRRPNGSQLLPVAMTTTRKRMALTRSVSRPLSMISNARHDSQTNTLRVYHAYPIKHKLKGYIMMKNFMTSRALSKGKMPKGDPDGKGSTPFPEEEAIMSINGVPSMVRVHNHF